MVRVEGEADHRCVNTACPAKLRESILHFAARSVMNIEGMGESMVNQLSSRGLVKDLADIYELNQEKLLSLERVEKNLRRTCCAKLSNPASCRWSA